MAPSPLRCVECATVPISGTERRYETSPESTRLSPGDDPNWAMSDVRATFKTEQVGAWVTLYKKTGGSNCGADSQRDTVSSAFLASPCFGLRHGALKPRAGKRQEFG